MGSFQKKGKVFDKGENKVDATIRRLKEERKVRTIKQQLIPFWERPEFIPKTVKKKCVSCERIGIIKNGENYKCCYCKNGSRKV